MPGDGDGDANNPPVIDLFTINGSPTPSLIEAAGAINLHVMASDPDADLTRVEFEANGMFLGSVSGAGPDFDLEWLLSGAELNGSYTVTATAFDTADHMSAPVDIDLGVTMPNGGTEAEQWTYDSGLLDSVYDVAVSPDGDQVVLAGQTSTMNGSGQRVDRVVGQAWMDKVTTDSISASGVVWADGTFVVAGSRFANMAVDNTLYAHDENGATTDTWTLEGAKLEIGNPEIIDTSSGLERDSTGRLYVIGTYTPQSGPLMGMRASFLLAATAAGDQEWLRWPTEDPAIMGEPILTDLAVSADDELAVIGTNSMRLWVSRWDQDGMLTSEYLPFDGNNNEGHAIAFGEGGELYIGGGLDTGNLGDVQSWVRKLDTDDGELWTDMPTQTGEGVTAAIAVDPWGEVVTASTEGCTRTSGGLTDCDLVVRKYDSEGMPMWTATWDAETFSGPINNLPGFDASLAIDRFGYVYVTAIAYTMGTGTDWWARKLHP
jgi:hypothetical protein